MAWPRSCRRHGMADVASPFCNAVKLTGKGVPVDLMVDNSPIANAVKGLRRLALERPGRCCCRLQRGGSRGLPHRDRQGSFAAGLSWFF